MSYFWIGLGCLVVGFVAGILFNLWMIKPPSGVDEAAWRRKWAGKQAQSLPPAGLSDEEAAQANRTRLGEKL